MVAFIFTPIGYRNHLPITIFIDELPDAIIIIIGVEKHLRKEKISVGRFGCL